MEKEKTFDRKGKELIVKDNEGVQLFKGDTIAYSRPNYYSEVKKGVIDKINPKSVMVNGECKYPKQILKI